MGKDDFKEDMIDWGVFKVLHDNMSWNQPQTLAVELENITFTEREAVSLNSTERNGGAMKRFAKRHPRESLIDKVVSSELDRDERWCITVKYTNAKRNGEPLGASKIADRLSHLTVNQVSYITKKAEKKIQKKVV